MFTINQLAELFCCSKVHWQNLVESGQLRAADLRMPGTTKSMLRIPRKVLVAFLEKRAAGGPANQDRRLSRP